MGVDHFQVSGSEALSEYEGQNKSIQAFRHVISALVGHDNPQQSKLDDYALENNEETLEHSVPSVKLRNKASNL